MKTTLLLLLLGLGVTTVVLLWKVLLTATAVALVQWAVTTQIDHPAAVAVAYAIPALAVAYLLTRRPAPRLPRSLRTAHAYRGGFR
ncbi:hypothetical protein [Umezawaea beigongshangensis]|uniref:hypothetical protein n=1 Tax=Umezawaea beigongshangensis TaxID=2780383 RepID=UPI0018F22C95|nr:hypothetical protein [Umezawaea beigongshangensis]